MKSWILFLFCVMFLGCDEGTSADFGDIGDTDGENQRNVLMGTSTVNTSAAIPNASSNLDGLKTAASITDQNQVDKQNDSHAVMPTATILAGAEQLGSSGIDNSAMLDDEDLSLHSTSDWNYGVLKVTTDYGYLRLGPANSSYCQFYTDRDRYYFDTELVVKTGMIGSYDEDLKLKTSGTTRIRVKNSTGYVGIGTNSPNYMLDVHGTIRGEEVIVEQFTPDYVFGTNYDLMSLEETEQFIDSNHHLPGMPSADDIAAHGVSIGNQNALLLQKIEELTLHTIAQQKEIEELKKRR